MPSDDPARAVRAALATFDRSFVSGDAAALTDCFAEDARLLLQHRAEIVGRAAIRDHWTRLFATYDTSAWQSEIQLLDAHPETATVMALYSETLVHRSGAENQVVHGRLAFFLQRMSDDWLVVLVMNAHDRPVELVPASSSTAPGPPKQGGSR